MIFADTSALYAALIADDVNHPRARRAEAFLREQREQIWTIDAVLTELWLLLRRDLTRAFCDSLVRGLMDHGLRREPVIADDYRRAWEIGRDWSDQRFSLTDRQAFAAIERSRQPRAWSYDADFTVMRLGPSKSQALEVVQ